MTGGQAQQATGPEIIVELDPANAQITPPVHQPTLAPQPRSPLPLTLAAMLIAAGVGAAYALGRRGAARPLAAAAAAREGEDEIDAFPGDASSDTPLLHQVLEEGPDMISRQTPEGRILYISSASRRILGYEPQEMIGRTIFDFLHPDEVFRGKSALAAAMRQSGPNIATQRVRRRDGSYILLESSSRIIIDPSSGDALGLVGVSREIGGRDGEQQALRENEALFRRAFEEAVLPIFMIDANSGHCIRVNTAFCRLLGYTRAELRELKWRDVTHPADWPLSSELDLRAVAGKQESFSLNKRFQRKEGSTVAARANIALLRDDLGQPMVFVSYIHLLEPAAEASDPAS
jgi:PAS domain S-box-containing protein